MLIDTMEAQNGRYRKDDDTVENFAVKDGFHTTSTELNALAEGNSFVSGYIFDGVASGGSAVVHFKTGSKVCVMSYGVGADGSCDYALYRNPVVTANGTQLLGVNRNDVTIKTPTAVAYRTPTTTSNGTMTVPRTNGGVSGPAKGGNSVSEGKLSVIPPNTSILIIATNKASNSARINIVVDWIEV